jgi:hypothetical protein
VSFSAPAGTAAAPPDADPDAPPAIVPGVIEEQFGHDSARARHLVSEHSLGSQAPCYYMRAQPSVVRYALAYTARRACLKSCLGSCSSLKPHNSPQKQQL